MIEDINLVKLAEFEQIRTITSTIASTRKSWIDETLGASFSTVIALIAKRFVTLES